jgi:hypothetical protein
MKDIEYFTFIVPPDIWRKKPGPSKFKMSAEYAAKVYPGSTPILSTREVRRLPSTPQELANAGRTHGDGVNRRPMTEARIGQILQEYEARLKREKAEKRTASGLPPD